MVIGGEVSVSGASAHAARSDFAVWLADGGGDGAWVDETGSEGDGVGGIGGMDAQFLDQ
ncbi:hypothetical protein [Streptomyces sp. NPDC059881]|uniref:hypothetical protein n=1 Tax=Streptomyces sp. NPDC059881 TaxID=3346986 RepID=UPI0036684E3A